jgi:hypothetical protein
MSKCNICKKEMDTGFVADADCGGDCTMCMANAGDPDCAHRLYEDLCQRIHDLVDNATSAMLPDVDMEIRQHLGDEFRFWR